MTDLRYDFDLLNILLIHTLIIVLIIASLLQSVVFNGHLNLNV